MASVVVMCVWLWTCPFCARQWKNMTKRSAIINGKAHFEERHQNRLTFGSPFFDPWEEGDQAPKRVVWSFNIVPDSKVADPPGSRGDLDHTVARG